MKRTTKAALLLLTSMIFLTGCAQQKGEIITIDNTQYVKSGDSYTKLAESKKTFNPGEHFVYYSESLEYGVFKGQGNIKDYETNQTGWGNVILNIPSEPDGYRYVNSIAIDTHNGGLTKTILHVFVNEEKVEAIAVYNKENDSIGFFEPGTPVKNLVLEQSY